MTAGSYCYIGPQGIKLSLNLASKFKSIFFHIFLLKGIVHGTYVKYLY